MGLQWWPNYGLYALGFELPSSRLLYIQQGAVLTPPPSPAVCFLLLNLSPRADNNFQALLTSAIGLGIEHLIPVPNQYFQNGTGS